jgi:hypothetical protein
MNPGKVDILLDSHVGILEGLVRGGFVAGFPVKDVVVFFVLLVGAKHRRSRLESFQGIDDNRQRLVIDLDSFHSIRSDVPVCRYDCSHLL